MCQMSAYNGITSTVSTLESKKMQTGSVSDGSSLEFEISKKLAEDWGAEVDFRILQNTVYADWHEIVLTPMDFLKSAAIDQWIKEECQGDCNHMGLVFLFEQQADAAMFALRFA